MIHPIAFNPPNVTLLCNICGWSGDVAVADLKSPVGIDNTSDNHFLILPCGNPACGSVSTHPIGGGAKPRHVQALFIVRLMQAQGLTFAQAKAAVKAAAEQMDGTGRFQLADVTSIAAGFTL